MQITTAMTEIPEPWIGVNGVCARIFVAELGVSLVHLSPNVYATETAEMAFVVPKIGVTKGPVEVSKKPTPTTLTRT